MKIHDSFPRYELYDPKVPVYCVTPNRNACFHRFFDTSPISPSGRYMAVFQMPFEDRNPNPGEKGAVVLIDLETGKDRVLLETCGWEAQMGANINWGGTDEELYFNDVDTKTWKPFAWKVNPLSGEKNRMEGTVYHASPDGKWLISANMTTMQKTQAGYGVIVPNEYVRRNEGLVDDDGFYLTDTSTGKSKLFASIKTLVQKADPAVQESSFEKHEVYGFHSKFNPQSDWIMASLRWFSKEEQTIPPSHSRMGFAWITFPVNALSPVHCAVGPEEWKKTGHHATWFPDGIHISMNLCIDRDVMRFVKVNRNGTGLCKILEKAIGSGHPTVHPNGTHLITDTYTSESVAFGDGTIPLRWVDLKTGTEEAIVRINTKPIARDGVVRVDPHPAWDRTWRYVVFNGFVNGTRNVYIADMQKLLDA